MQGVTSLMESITYAGREKPLRPLSHNIMDGTTKRRADVLSGKLTKGLRSPTVYCLLSDKGLSILSFELWPPTQAHRQKNRHTSFSSKTTIICLLIQTVSLIIHRSWYFLYTLQLKLFATKSVCYGVIPYNSATSLSTHTHTHTHNSPDTIPIMISLSFLNL